MVCRGRSTLGSGLVIGLAVGLLGGCGGDTTTGTQVKVDEAKQASHQKGMEEFMRKQGQAKTAPAPR